MWDHPCYRYRVAQDCIYLGIIRITSTNSQVYIEVKRTKVLPDRGQKRSHRPRFVNLYSFKLDMLGKTTGNGLNKVIVQTNLIVADKNIMIGHFGGNPGYEELSLVDVVRISRDLELVNRLLKPADRLCLTRTSRHGVVQLRVNSGEKKTPEAVHRYLCARKRQ